MERFILIFAFCLIFYNISGLATTNILRLTRGNSLPILSSKCSCDSCGMKITPPMQLPIISFVICGGRCTSCGIKLPRGALLLEITLLSGMLLITSAMSFSLLGVTCGFVFYELVRVAVIIINGKRETDFAKQYAIAVAAMLPYYAVTLFVSVLYTSICK